MREEEEKIFGGLGGENGRWRVKEEEICGLLYWAGL